MRIGEVAQIVGISARSIRHYHRLGVIAEPERTSGGYRSYEVADLARIARIAFLNSSGVPLRDIGSLLESDEKAGKDQATGRDGSAVANAVTDLAAIREGIDQQIEQLTRQRDRLDAIAQRAADGLPPGFLPEPVSMALNICRADAANDPGLLALLQHEHDMLDLLALAADFPEALISSYVAIGSNAERRCDYLNLLAGFQGIAGRRPADVEPEIARLVDILLSDADIRALVAGAPTETGPADADAKEPTRSGPTLDQLLPDPAQREVLRRTLTALGVLP